MRESLSVFGCFDFIDEGEVSPVGDTGYYRVNDRTATGLLGSAECEEVDEAGGSEPPESDIQGTLTMTYDAIVEKDTQAGPFWGNLWLHDEVRDITYTARFFARSEGVVTEFNPDEGGTMIIEIEGRLTFTDNAHGRAQFDGTIEVALDAEGHIAGINDSEINIDGWWEPEIEDRSPPHLANRLNADGEDPVDHQIEDAMPEAVLV